MSKEKYNQIILDVYREHQMEQSRYLRHGGTLQEFINKCKTDPEFSEKWGLKIEERELSDNERQGILERVSPMYYMDQQFGGEDIFTRNNIPTKLITLTYNNETIESHE